MPMTMKGKPDKIKKIIAFDLDETLGYFSEFGVFYDAIEQFTGTELTRVQSFKVIELFEKEIVRPKINTILRSIMSMKKKNNIDYVMIYTNNQGGEHWTYMIKDYFEYKLGLGKIFDKIICAYKISGRNERSCEECRTTHSKTYNDLVVNCCKLPKTTKVCFIDDRNHPYMKNNPNVYYIKVTPYIYSLTPQIFIERFLESRLSSKIRGLKRDTDFTHFVLKYFKDTSHYSYIPKTRSSLTADHQVSTELLRLVRNFGEKII